MSAIPLVKGIYRTHFTPHLERSSCGDSGLRISKAVLRAVLGFHCSVVHSAKHLPPKVDERPCESFESMPLNFGNSSTSAHEADEQHHRALFCG